MKDQQNIYKTQEIPVYKAPKLPSFADGTDLINGYYSLIRFERFGEKNGRYR